MSFRRCLQLGTVLVVAATVGAAAIADDLAVKISPRPRHDGRINPMLFGNFIELLDDLVPGMWAEMLNDRGFEGVVPAADWVYHDGSATFCDRAWDETEGWSLENAGAFNGPRCARITARDGRWAGLTQSGLAVKTGEAYRFSAFVRGAEGLRAQVLLKAEQPDGSNLELSAAQPVVPSARWARVSGVLKANGTTDRAILEIRARGEGSLWVDKVSLMPERNRHGWRDDVVDAIKESRPGVIRGGGSVVDPGAYRWK